MTMLEFLFLAACVTPLILGGLGLLAVVVFAWRGRAVRDPEQRRFLLGLANDVRLLQSHSRGLHQRLKAAEEKLEEINPEGTRI